jgi:hypothetical protein
MIEIPEMLNLIEIAVSERGETFKYQDYDVVDMDALNCQYRHPVTGKPLCIAGVALAEAGLLDQLVEDEIVSAQSGLVGKVSRPALDVLDAAQAAQDSYMTWGYALNAARWKAEELQS